MVTEDVILSKFNETNETKENFVFNVYDTHYNVREISILFIK